MRRPLVTLAALLALAAPLPAVARAEDDDEVFAAGICANDIEADLSVRPRNGGLDVEFEVDSDRAGERWRVTLVHERRTAWRGIARTRSGGAFRVRRTLPDLSGADMVSIRAVGPGGQTCRATVTVAG